MNLKLETEFSRAPILQEIDALKKQIDSMRPLPPDVEGRVMQKLRLDWNYNSNAIEGNKLSYGETTALLMHGITAKGKPLKDHLDIQGHNNVVGYLERMVKDERDFTESDIRALHEVLLVEPYFVDAQTVDGLSTRKWIEIGKYKSLPNHVETRTREIHYYATPEETPALMDDLMSWYVKVSENKEIHPVIIAALFHHKFVEIHPFDDGNGRMARILMNLILMKKGYPVAIIKNDNKDNYYALLSRADVGDSWPFVEYIIDRLQNSIQLYLKAINGGDVDEDEDIDKEIELLRIQLGGGVNIKEKKTVEFVQNVFFKSILPLSIKIVDKLRGFEEYFFKNNYWLRFYYSDGNKDFELIGTEYTTEYFRRLPQIDEVTGIEINNLINMEIDLRFVEYKNPDNSFNVIELLNIQLGVYYYSFIGEEGTMVSKLYEEQLSIHDQNKIIKSVIRNFKNKFEFNLKKANS